MRTVRRRALSAGRPVSAATQGPHAPGSRERVPECPADPDAAADGLREPGREQAPGEERGSERDGEGKDARRRPEDDRRPPPPHRCRLAGQEPCVNHGTIAPRTPHATRRSAGTPPPPSPAGWTSGT